MAVSIRQPYATAGLPHRVIKSDHRERWPQSGVRFVNERDVKILRVFRYIRKRKVKVLNRCVDD